MKKKNSNASNINIMAALNNLEDLLDKNISMPGMVKDRIQEVIKILYKDIKRG